MTLLEQALERFSNRLTTVTEKITETPSQWIEKYFYVPDSRDPKTDEKLGKGPLRLASHQKHIIDEALSKNPDGTFKYSTVIYSAPKKSGKSALASAVTLYFGHHNSDGNVYCLANDKTQSTDRIYSPIRTCFRLHRELGGIFSDINASLTEVTLPNNTKIRAIPCDAAGEAGSQPLLSTWCYDQDTEILTRSGWKNYQNLTIEDEVATLSPDGLFEWQKPKAVNISPYKGKMWLGETSRMSVCVTPNHRMYGKFLNSSNKPTDIKTDWSVKPIEEALQYKFTRMRVAGSDWKGEIPFEYVTIPATVQRFRKPELKIRLDLYVKFLGWYLSEGCVHTRNGRPEESVMIGQSKTANPDKYKQIEDLVREMGFEPHSWNGTCAVIVYDCRIAQHLKQFGLCHEKYIPEWIKNLPKEYLQIFMDAYRAGDGWKLPTGFAIGTVSTRMKDDLAEIGLKLGYTVSSSAFPDKRSKYLQHKIRFYSGNGGNKTRIISRDQWKEIDYEGYVFCPSTDNGVVFTRRRGFYSINGNSELWAFETENKRRLWTEMTIPPTLEGYAMRWVESYAGFTGKSELLEQLYNMAVKQGEPHPDFDYLISEGKPAVYVNEAAGIFCYWDEVPRMIWQSQRYYAQQSLTLQPSEFLRIHRNQWVSPVDSFIQPEMWNSCKKEIGPIRDKKTPVILGVDGAISNDYAAIVGVTRDPDDNDSVAVRFCYIFTPQKSGGTIKISETVEPKIRELCKAFNVLCVAYDKYQLEDMAQRLRKDGIVWMYSFNQQGDRAVADKGLYDRVINHRIYWDANGDGLDKNGDLPSLFQHITQAGTKTDNGKMRLEKLTDSAKIDAAVALSMATEKCMNLNIDNRESKVNLAEKFKRGTLTDDDINRLVEDSYVRR
jgi:phage terminase large subunit-like protein